MCLKQSSLRAALEKGFLFCMFAREKYILKKNVQTHGICEVHPGLVKAHDIPVRKEI